MEFPANSERRSTLATSHRTQCGAKDNRPTSVLDSGVLLNGLNGRNA